MGWMYSDHQVCIDSYFCLQRLVTCSRTLRVPPLHASCSTFSGIAPLSEITPPVCPMHKCSTILGQMFIGVPLKSECVLVSLPLSSQILLVLVRIQMLEAVTTSRRRTICFGRGIGLISLVHVLAGMEAVCSHCLCSRCCHVFSGIDRY